MIKTAAGPQGVWPAASEQEVDEATGLALIAAGAAVHCGAVRVGSKESAALAPAPATAVLPKPRAKKGSQ